MNKVQLTEELALHADVLGGTNAAAKRILDFMLETIVLEVRTGNEVTIAGFGKFYPYKLASGKTVPKFKAYDNFKKAM